MSGDNFLRLEITFSFSVYLENLLMTLCWDGYTPVNQLILDGTVQDDTLIICLKLNPLFAIMSIVGVIFLE
jgi:hypothetical protein